MKTLRTAETDFDAILLGEAEIARVEAVYDMAARMLLGRRPGVVGIGIGHKWTNGVAAREACLHVFVVEKRPLDAVPEDERIPALIKDVKTDVLEVGRLEFQAGTAKVRPLQSGVSVGTKHGTDSTTGTLGGFVKNVIESQEHYYILSNNHVLASNNAFPVGAPCYQQSVGDGGTATEICGQLSAFIPLSTTRDNEVDAAIAAVEKDLIAGVRPYSANPVPAKDVKVGTKVTKDGRTSGLTAGVVTTLNVTIVVTSAAGDRYTMVGQYACDYACQPGDSGSLVLRETDNRPVGLHFAGSSQAATMCSIEKVLSLLQVTLY